jgi:MSHA pilin protein MshD
MLRRTDRGHYLRQQRARGSSLVELIMFIVIIGIAVAGVLGAMSLSTRASADPLIQKQALAIAEAYLEEVLAMPFTYCDPDDVDAASATSAWIARTSAPASRAAAAVSSARAALAA